MKASIVSFAIIISLSFLLLSAFILVSYKYYFNYEKNVEQRTANYIAFSLLSEIAELHQNCMVNESYEKKLLEKKVILPEKLSSKNYKVIFMQDKLMISVSDKSYEFKLPKIQAILEGKIYGGEAKIVCNSSAGKITIST
ncbi:MAG: hypothetical protein QXO84_01775 [Candidatus Aenigmatarchaeota archaeon]